MSQLLLPDLVSLDADLGADAQAVIPELARRVSEAGRATEGASLAADALARESTSATGLPGGIAIPHCRSASVTEPTVAFARLSPKADFGAPDGPADLVFMIAAPEGGGAEHLTLLSSLARSLVRPEFTAALRAATTPDEVVRLVEEAVAPAEAPAAAAAPTAPAAQESAPATQRRIVAVTACPTGIAHTYMAADSLVQAGERAGVDLVVETQGSSGSKPLSPATIQAADAVIFATDVGVRDKGRFAGKPVIESGVKRAINEPDVMVTEALAAADDPSSAKVAAGGQGSGSGSSAAAASGGFGGRLKRYLLTGVSYMIPFVAAGGLLIALGFLLGGYEMALAPAAGDAANQATAILNGNSLTNLPDPTAHALFGSGFLTYIGAMLFLLGAWAFGFLVPALAGYIAYAIADRPGIAPGFVMGFLANQIGAGFLGGIVGGLLAGAVALYISKPAVPRWLAGLMPVVIIPLGATLISGLVMLLVLGKPIASIQTNLTDWLNGLSGSSVLILGLILGAMMAFDMGGPVNKAAYVFATTGLTASAIASGDATQLKIMAAVMAAGMTPPLAMALSTVLRPKLYTEEERENGKAAWLLGASFITEGAIPFAAADPLRVIPANMVGSAVTGAIVMTTGVTLTAPHGGIFVFFAMGKVAFFLLAIVVGTVISALGVTALKQFTRTKAEDAVLADAERTPVAA
ncbi:PTS fructose transporter subunit IIABC [Solicola sp. PLA-1-18]|uniref:PTS fructose transporter subunit IIABC n=1 Tax=Solicola sp. PLA-1-18 TaxID=3380532 RepID=UPI003B798C33